MTNRPTGTVTFLFTDIEGSTQRWEGDPTKMQAAHSRHEAILRRAVEDNGGYAYKMIGDAFQVAFPTARQALQAALEAQRSLHSESWGEDGELRVRMALHTGITEEREGDYVGPLLNRVARLMSAGHGGQVLVSLATYELVRDYLPSGVTLKDIGEYRLKDLIRPEHVFQLVAPDLPSDFPPLKTLENRPNNLPLQPTPFIGREKELTALVKLLLHEDVRLVTLTGPAGVGKSRLAVQAAAELVDDFADGVFFVSLASAIDPTLVVSGIAQALGVKEAGDRPLLDVLKEELRSKSMLLVLDNFEQVVQAAPLVSELLQSASQLKILATSRTVLHLRGEKEFPVPSLSMPDPKRLPKIETLLQYEAVALFIQRALDVKPDFAITNDSAPAVAKICVRLDGLPLAIELAATRIRFLPPQAMLARLQSRLKLLTGGARDLPARQQTLRGAIEWSYDLLDEGEQQLFRRMAVFQGGRRLEALEAVCNAEGDLEIDLLDGVESLVSNSLLRQEEDESGEPSFVMLETIHEYAKERLEESGEAETLRRRHTDYFLALAEEAEPHLRGPRQVEWMELLEREHDNFRAALQWSLETGQEGRIGAVDQSQDGAEGLMYLRLAGVLGRFWDVRGHLSEGRQWLKRVLDKSHATQSAEGNTLTLLRARALLAMGRLSRKQGDLTQAQALLSEGLALYEQVEDKWGIAETLNILATAKYGAGEYGAARPLWERALASFREVNDESGIARTLNNLGEMARARGDYKSARTYYEQGLAVMRQQGEARATAVLTLNLGSIEQRLGNYSRAAELFKESLAPSSDLGDISLIAICIYGFAAIAAGKQQGKRAATLFAAGAALLQTIGIVLDPSDRIEHDRSMAAARAQVDEGVWAKAWEEGRAMSMEQAVAYALE